jgi:ketosteroid isomerase-like protein
MRSISKKRFDMKKVSLVLSLLIAIEAGGGVLNSFEAARSTLLKADAEFGETLSTQGPEKAYLAFMADDGNLLARLQPVITGREAVGRFVADKEPRTFSNWRALRAGVSSAGDMGYTAGIFDFSAKGAGQQSGQGAYLFCWKKQGSAWKIVASVETVARSPLVANADKLSSAQPQMQSAVRNKSDIESARAAIMKADSDFSDLSERGWAGEAFAAYITDDGGMLGLLTTGLSGKEAVRAAFGERPTPGDSLVWKPVIAGMSASCDLGFTIGYSVSKGADAERKPRVNYGHYLTIWQKQADGVWKFVLDGGSPAPAPK